MGIRLFIHYLLIFVLTFLIFQLYLHDKVHHEDPMEISTKKSENVSLKIDEKRGNHSLINETKNWCSVSSPSRWTIEYNNIYWQQYLSSNGSFYLFNAFYDIRSSVGLNPTVRILSMIDRLSPPKLYCQIWFHNSSLSVRTIANYHYIWFEKWGNYRDGYLQPYLINCPIYRKKTTKNSLRPKSISIFENRCANLTNQLEINSNYFDELKEENGEEKKKKKRRKEKFAVCVKGLDFPSTDLSVRLIEWIELIRLLGGMKIIFYQFEIHPNIERVLKYYQDEDFVEIHRLTLPGSQPNLHSIRRDYFRERMTIRRQHEIIPYNDCFYRHFYHFDFILLLDIDEIILPLKDSNWIEMFERFDKEIEHFNETFVAFSARNIYFFNENLFDIVEQLNSTMKNEFNSIPKSFHMLKQIQRSNVYNRPGAYVKTFFDTQQIIAVHNHFPLGCFSSCRRYDLPTSLVHLQHYRDDCVKELKKSCSNYRNNSLLDFTIWKYRHNLIDRTSHVAQLLNLIE